MVNVLSKKVKFSIYPILRDAIYFGNLEILNLILNHPDINVNKDKR